MTIKKLVLGFILTTGLMVMMHQVTTLANTAPIESQVDALLFSLDRPLQLRALLESMYQRIAGIKQINVLYRASNERFNNAYQKLSILFPTVKFIKQINPPNDFKSLLIDTVFNQSKAPYILFGVDDMVIIDAINLHDCIDALEEKQAYAFYLRLGKDITQSYCLSILNNDYTLPPLKEIKHGIYAWKFNEGLYEWYYPHSVDMSLFRKKDIKEDVMAINFNSPNSFEVQWNLRGNREKIGLCYGISKTVNIPLNAVQEDKGCFHLHYVTTEELLEDFELGFKMDIKPLEKFQHKSPHITYMPRIIHE